MALQQLLRFTLSDTTHRGVDTQRVCSRMAAQEKENRAKSEKEKALQDERQMLDRLVDGMAPARRMKKGNIALPLNRIL